MIGAAAMCLALNIYFEARNQPIQGQIAVAEVTLNRVASEKHPDTICGVVKQSNKNGCAFSWYCDDNSDKPKEKEAFQRAQILSEMLIKNSKYIYVLGNRATHYHNDTVNPYWAKKFYKLKKIGDHIFYSEDLWLEIPYPKPKNLEKMVCESNPNHRYISNGINVCVRKNLSGETKKVVSR